MMRELSKAYVCVRSGMADRSHDLAQTRVISIPCTGFLRPAPPPFNGTFHNRPPHRANESQSQDWSQVRGRNYHIVHSPPYSSYELVNIPRQVNLGHDHCGDGDLAGFQQEPQGRC